jgi:predicted hydrolase (HD superfamily)
MLALARKFQISNDKLQNWGIVGLIHDADYEKWPKEHPLKLVEELENNHVPQWLVDAVKSHAWGYKKGLPEPKTKMEWALYCCDELTGLIVAVALVKPDKKLASVTVDSVMKKWNSSSFAAGVDRKQIELCEEKLGIKLHEFIEITLKAMQQISKKLGL